jgi:hypothetical protein
MPASTNIIGDLTTVYTNGPSSTTKANAIAANGPITDYPGVTQGGIISAGGALELLTAIKGDTDAGDGNLTDIEAVMATLAGTSSPSATVITAMQTVIAAGPSDATKAKAIAAAGEIMDYVGNLNLVLTKLEELLVRVTALYNLTDNGTDGTNRGLLANIKTALS